MPKLEPARHSSDFTAQTQDIRPDPLHRAATTSAADLPRYLPPLPYRKSIKPADSPATVNSYTTAYSNFPTVTATPIRQQRVNSHTPSALPPLTVRNGYDTYAKDPALDASHTLEANKHHRRRMTHQRNDTHNGIHDAAREPLIARGNEPVSSKKAEAMRRKLRAYEAVLAFKNGCMPDTQQLGGWAQYLLRSSSVLDSRNRRLSSKGREFVRDTRAWVEALVDLLLSKNYDDKIQEFIWHTSHAGVSATVPDVGGAVKAGASGSKGDASKALERLRGLAGLLWSSSEFRALIGDFAGMLLLLRLMDGGGANLR
jgi:hypothetical protein